jgi:flagellar biogenesis protein FliO
VDVLQQLAAVAFVISLLGAVLWVLKRRNLLVPRRTGERQLVIVERVALGPQHSLSLVKVNGVTVLVGTGPGVCEIRNVETHS